MNKKYYNDIIYGVNNHIYNIKSNFQVDDLDIKLINLMMKGNNNRKNCIRDKGSIKYCSKKN